MNMMIVAEMRIGFFGLYREIPRILSDGNVLSNIMIEILAAVYIIWAFYAEEKSAYWRNITSIIYLSIGIFAGIIELGIMFTLIFAAAIFVISALDEYFCDNNYVKPRYRMRRVHRELRNTTMLQDVFMRIGGILLLIIVITR